MAEVFLSEAFIGTAAVAQEHQAAAVDDRRIVREDQLRDRGGGVLLVHHDQQFFEPERIGQRIGIEQHEDVSLGVAGGEVVPFGEAEVVSAADEPHPGEGLCRGLERAVLGGVVHHDHFEVAARNGLIFQRFQAGGEGAAAVVVHDQHAGSHAATALATLWR